MTSRPGPRRDLRATLASICLGMAGLLAMPAPSVAQLHHATNYDVAKLPVQQDVPINLDPSNGVTQGIFRPTTKTTVISMNADGWVGPAGAGIYLGSAAKIVPNAWCNVLVKPVAADQPAVVLDVECTLAGLWYSAVRRDDMHVVGLDGRTGDFSLAEVVDGGFRVLRIKSKSMASPVTWRMTGRLGRTADIAGLGSVAVFARPQIPSDQLVLVLTAAQAETLAKRLSAADRATVAKIVGR